MPFEVYATRRDSPNVVSQIIPAKGLSFSFPLSAHGECSFSATVEPGRSFWRSSLGGPRSGVLIVETLDSGIALARWGGRLKAEQQQPGTREFQFTFAEWGSGLSWFPAPVDRWDNERDTDIYTDILTRVQAVPGQNLAIQTTGVTPGNTVSDFEVKAWDDTTAEEALSEIASREGGPEWYVGVGGTLKFPVRQATAGDRLGSTQAVKVLEFVEDTADRDPVDPNPPGMTLLSTLFPAGTQPVANGLIGRRGGNVLAVGRSQDTERSATVVVAIGAGQEAAQIRETAVAQDLLNAGFPRITKTVTFENVSDRRTLQRHAQAELAACRGVLTDYSLVTQGSAPDWREVPRGSTVRVELDTDVYATRRPFVFEPRLLNMTVAVPDDGGAEQVKWDVGSVLQLV